MPSSPPKDNLEESWTTMTTISPPSRSFVVDTANEMSASSHFVFGFDQSTSTPTFQKIPIQPEASYPVPRVFLTEPITGGATELNAVDEALGLEALVQYARRRGHEETQRCLDLGEELRSAWRSLVEVEQSTTARLELEVEEASRLSESMEQACNEVIRSEARRGRELLLQLSMLRKYSEQELTPIRSEAIKSPAASEQKRFEEMRAEMRTKAEILEAEAAGAAAACEEARTARANVEKTCREQCTKLREQLEACEEAHRLKVAELRASAQKLLAEIG